MSTPPVPAGMADDMLNNVANQLHSVAIHILRNARAADRKTGLTPERLSLLSVLAYAGPKTISELAAAEMVSLPAITRIVNYLEELGLVTREKESEDGRIVRVAATDEGEEIMEEGRRRRVERIAENLSDLRDLEMMVVAEAANVLSRLDERRSQTA